MSDHRIARTLAAASVLLALFCVALAAAWAREHREARCWRQAAEDGEFQAQGDCHRPLKLAGVTLLP